LVEEVGHQRRTDFVSSKRAKPELVSALYPDLKNRLFGYTLDVAAPIALAVTDVSGSRSVDPRGPAV
jgi:hypothetical protein